MIAAYILGPLFLILVIVVVYKLIRCMNGGRNWPDDYPDGWG